MCACVHVSVHFYKHSPAYTEPTVADDSKMKDGGVDADALVDSRDLTGTYIECSAGIYKMLQVTSTTVPQLLLCVFQVVGSDYY